MEIVAFVEAQLPPIPARVLEIGCGEGELARAVARLGYLYADWAARGSSGRSAI
jgi:spermidine synthase